jgi:hypothetical protein
MSRQFYAPKLLSPRKEPGTRQIKAGWASQPAWTLWRTESVPSRESNPGRPARSPLAVLLTVRSRLLWWTLSSLFTMVNVPPRDWVSDADITDTERLSRYSVWALWNGDFDWIAILWVSILSCPIQNPKYKKFFPCFYRCETWSLTVNEEHSLKVNVTALCNISPQV